MFDSKEIDSRNNKEFEQRGSIQEFLTSGEDVLWTSKTYAKYFVKTKMEEEAGDSERYYMSGNYGTKYTATARIKINEMKFLYSSLIVLGVGLSILSVLILKAWWGLLISASLLICGVIGFAKMANDARLFKRLIDTNNIYVLTNRRIIILDKMKNYNLIKDFDLIHIKSVSITNLYNERRDIGDVTIIAKNDEQIKLNCVKGVRAIYKELNKNI